MSGQFSICCWSTSRIWPSWTCAVKQNTDIQEVFIPLDWLGNWFLRGQCLSWSIPPPVACSAYTPTKVLAMHYIKHVASYKRYVRGLWAAHQRLCGALPNSAFTTCGANAQSHHDNESLSINLDPKLTVGYYLSVSNVENLLQTQGNNASCLQNTGSSMMSDAGSSWKWFPERQSWVLEPRQASENGRPCWPFVHWGEAGRTPAKSMRSAMMFMHMFPNRTWTFSASLLLTDQAFSLTSTA